jgi:nitroreductase / dihydropteridine reductase
MEFSEIVNKRFACKKFNGKKIPQAKVDELLDIIRLSASSYNLQPWKIQIITDPKTKESLQVAAKNQAQIGTCSHVLVFFADTNLEALVDEMDAEMKRQKVLDKNREPRIALLKTVAQNKKPADRLSWAQRQVYLALGNALNGATSLGFDACPMEGFDFKEVTEILKPPQHRVVTTLCPIGFASDEPRPKIRFSRKFILT